MAARFSNRFIASGLASALAVAGAACPVHAASVSVIYAVQEPSQNGIQEPSDGALPYSDLVKLGGMLYGTTEVGGTNNLGTVFKVTPEETETVLYSFAGGSDGAHPIGGLTSVGGVLFGTTTSGGNEACDIPGTGISGCGTVFRVTQTGSETVLYSFAGGSDGVSPTGDLINVGGTLYGTTQYGGGGGCSLYAERCGTVFAVSRDGTESVLHAFAGGSDGAYPLTAGLMDFGGTLYGTTSYGGGGGPLNSGGCGTVFAIPPSGTLNIVYAFNGGSDGGIPVAGLREFRGKLYGTTEIGCGNNNDSSGTVFAVTPEGSEAIIHAFGAGDGTYPASGLIPVDGLLYGTTSDGGASGFGTVFTVQPNGKHIETALYSFKGGSDGAHPSGRLVYLNGALYGTTFNGGGFGGPGCGGGAGCGTVFKVTP